MRENDHGFTLIELLVVMIIISILMAVAIPVFLGQKQKALASNAKGLVKSVQSTMESCSAATTTGAFTDETGTPICTQGYVMDDEGGLASKTCRGTRLPGHPAPHGASECWSLFNSTHIQNEGYTIIAKTANVSGQKWGWFALHRTSAGVIKICGASTDSGAWPVAAPINANTSWDNFASDLFRGKGDSGTVTRLCPTGTW
jgi:prepilin-type N-terminal cleavage/methylation domain-containing protein